MAKKDYNPSKAHQDATKKPNPIEEAIGERAKPKTEVEKILQTPAKVAQEILSSTPDEPSPSEMLTLENLNRRTEARLRDDPTIAEMATLGELGYDPSPAVKTKILETQIPYVPPKTTIPVSKPGLQPATKTSSLESPVEKNEPYIELDELVQELNLPVEDIELTALRKYILEDGFVLATVAFHIVSLCAEPLTTPSTTTWDFKDRAMVPDMVLALLNQPGYIEGIWPSLKIVMGSNKGNAAWSAGIATTIAFFDTIRVLPSLKELKKDVDK